MSHEWDIMWHHLDLQLVLIEIKFEVLFLILDDLNSKYQNTSIKTNSHDIFR